MPDPSHIERTLPAKTPAKDEQRRAVMKTQFRDSTKHSGLSAFLTVVGILPVGALAKTDVTTQLFHLAP